MRSLPRLAGRVAVNFYKDSFKRGGFIDEGFQKWPSRKRPERGKRRALLVKSGRLRRSIRVVRTTFNSVTIGTDVPYAKIHNEGGKVQGTVKVKEHTRGGYSRKRKGRTQKVSAHPVKGHTRQVSYTIPQRQFMGKSTVLNRRIQAQIKRQLEKTL